MRSTEQTQDCQVGITDLGEHWIQTKMELIRITTIEKVSGLAGSIAFMFLLMFFSLISFGFITIALALFIAEQVGSMVMGFGLTAAVYIAIAVVIAFIGRDFVRERIMDWLIKEITEHEQ